MSQEDFDIDSLGECGNRSAIGLLEEEVHPTAGAFQPRAEFGVVGPDHDAVAEEVSLLSDGDIGEELRAVLRVGRGGSQGRPLGGSCFFRGGGLPGFGATPAHGQGDVASHVVMGRDRLRRFGMCGSIGFQEQVAADGEEAADQENPEGTFETFAKAAQDFREATGGGTGVNSVHGV